jgi:hypothetical protein
MKARGLLLLLMLAGCASPETIRQSPPEYLGTSSRPAVDVATCIADEWGKTRKVSMRPTQGGYTVTLTDNVFANNNVIADVIGKDDGSMTTYQRYLMSPAFDQAITSCQGS